MRRAIADFEAEGGVFIKKEVTVEIDGIRNRFDFVGKKDGVIHLFEVKNGPYASPTKNQSINIPKLMNQNAKFIPVGKNAQFISDFNTYVLTKTPYNGNIKIVYIHYY